VSSAAALAGLPASTFASAGGKATFSAAVASVLPVGVDAGAVSTSSVTATAAASCLVNFTIQASLSYTDAFAIAAVIAAAATPAAFLVAQNAGLATLSGYTGPVLQAPADVVFVDPLVSLPAAKVNLSDVSDTTVAAATANVAAQFVDLSSDAAVLLQSSFLTSLNNETHTVVGDVGGLSLSQAAASASLLVAIMSGGDTTLTADNQDTALNILNRIAAAPIDATAGTAQNVVSALSAVYSAALGGGNAAALQQVGGVIDQLSISQAQSMVDALKLAPDVRLEAITNTASIQTLVAVDPAGSTRLYDAPLTVLGSASSFEPMPAGLLPATTSVVTSFFALTFDPNGNRSTLNTTGLTRLAFSNADGTPIVVANATTPIRFSLPPVDTAGDEAQAVCAFWNTATGAYDTAGCAGVPSPFPPGHVVRFLDNFTAHSDPELAMAWNITGPMVDNGTCFVAVLDCTSDNPGPYFMDSDTRELVLSHHPAIIYPDPFDPLSVPAVACQSPAAAGATEAGSTSSDSGGNATSAASPPRTLRVYYGTDCALWREDNAVNCSWSNTKQSFVGAGCVSGGPTQCMCRHLTDFASARTPKIETCSLADMTSFSAADIVTKLRFLFIVVISLFGAMNVGAVIAFTLDMQERRATLEQLMHADAGFAEQASGAWTWRCVQEPLQQAVQAPTGSAIHIAAVLGIPFIRLRAAMPTELFAGNVGQALGRRAGLSVQGLEEARDENMAAMMQLLAGLSCFGAKRMPIPATELLDDVSEQRNDCGVRAYSGVGGTAAGAGTISGTASGAASSSATVARRGVITDDSPQPYQLHTSKDERLAQPPAWSIGSPAQRAAFMRLRSVEESPDGDADDAGVSDALAEEMVGTALVFAFMENTKVLPVAELARRVSAARAHFRGAALTAVDHDFDALRSMFLVMLSPGNLSNRSSWLDNSRLWRFILMQRADGGWDMTQSLAFALQAHDGAAPPPRLPPSKLRTVLMTLLGGDDDLDDALDDAIDEALTSSDEDEAADAATAADGDAAAAVAIPRVKDCPLSFSRNAVRRWLPPALAALNKEYEQQEADAACARQLELLQREMAAQQPASPSRAQSGKRLAAAAEAALRTHQSEPFAVTRALSASALLSMVDSAITALQRELVTFRQKVDGAPPGDPRTERMHAVERSTSRRLQRLITLRVTLPPAPPAPPAGTSAATNVAAATPRAVVSGALTTLAGGTPSSFDGTPVVGRTTSAFEEGGGTPTFSCAAAIGRTAPTLAGTPAFGSTSATSLTSTISAAPPQQQRRRMRMRTRLPVERIWSTLLALAVLEELDSCWLTDEEADVARTVVDAGRDFLEAQSRSDRRVRKLLKSGAVHAAAERARKQWRAIQTAQVAALRDADVINRFTALTHMQRASARIVRSMMTDHSTFATFLDTDGYIMRWQRFMILVTLVLSTLLTSIWFYCAFPGSASQCAPPRACAHHACIIRRPSLLTSPLRHTRHACMPRFRLARRAVLRRDPRHLGL
jgi:hypothetical protein